MRSSTVLAVAVLAAASPALSAPTLPLRTARSSSSGTFSTPPPSNDGASGAIDLSTIGNITSIALPLITEIIDHFKNKTSQQQTREVVELFGRDHVASGALNLDTLGNITSLALPIISEIIDHFKNKSSASQPQAREVFQLRFDGEEVEDVEKVAKFTLDDAKNIASIGSSVVSVIHNIFSGGSKSSSSSSTPPASRRELIELPARADVDDPSGALSLGTIFSLGSSVLGGIIDHFKNKGTAQQARQARELESIFARDSSVAPTDDQSAALSLGTIFSLGSSVLGGIIDHFKNKGNAQQAQQARELETLFARDVPGVTVDESGALSFKDIGSFLLGAGGLVGDVFGRDLPSPSVDESGALSLQDVGNFVLTAGSLLGDILRRHDGINHEQRRELLELLERQDATDSGALSLGTIFSLGSSVLGEIIDHFKNKQSRSIDDSAALELLLGPNGLLTTPTIRPGGIARPDGHVARSAQDDSVAKLLALYGLHAPKVPLGAASKRAAAASLNDLD